MPDNTAIDDPSQELTFQVPLSEVYRFSRPGKMEELTRDHREGPSKPAAMAPAKRFIISTIGIFCLMIGLTGIFGRNPNIFSFLWIVLGAAIIWVFLAKPEMDKRKTGTGSRTARDPEVTLIFTPGKIVMRSPLNETGKDWSELIEYRKTKKGVQLHFLDGAAIWLPENAFYDRDEMKELMQLVQKKVPGLRSQASG